MKVKMAIAVVLPLLFIFAEYPQANASVSAGQIYNGRINSVLNTGGSVWIAEGDWDLVVDDRDDVRDFTVDMIWFTSDGIRSHTHAITDLDPDVVTRSPDGTYVIRGDADVWTEGETTWRNVPTVVTLGAGRTLSVQLDDVATDAHFGGQTIFGLVQNVADCGNTPGPAMTLRAPCTVEDITGPAVIQGPSGQTIITGP